MRNRVIRIVSSATLAVAALSAALSSNAQDQVHTNTFEITPFAGIMTGGSFENPTDNSDRDVNDDTNFGVFVNLVTDIPERQYELLYTSQSSDVDGGATPLDLDIQYLHIGGIVGYPQSRHAIPYFGVTVGAARFSPDLPGLDDETKVSFSVGGGVKVPITDHIGVRFDVRAFITLLEDDTEIFCASASGEAACGIKPKSDTFLQYTGTLGLTVGF